VAVDIAPDLPLVEPDGNPLELALINLAVNARDAMAQGGTLTVTCDLDVCGEANDLSRRDYLRIRVADTGEGMSEETLARAKRTFFHETARGPNWVFPWCTASQRSPMARWTLPASPPRGTVVMLWLRRTRTRCRFPVCGGNGFRAAERQPSKNIVRRRRYFSQYGGRGHADRRR
jgi:hypothetical protein